MTTIISPERYLRVGWFNRLVNSFRKPKLIGPFPVLLGTRLLADAKLDYTNSILRDFVTKSLQWSNAFEKRQLFLLVFPERISTSEMRRYVEDNLPGYALADLEMFVAFIAQHPNIQMQIPVVAPGVAVERSDGTSFPVAWGGTDEDENAEKRAAFLLMKFYHWISGFCFLLVQK